MKKTSVSTNGSNNRLSYLDSYEEIIKYKKSSRTLFTRRNADIVLNRGTRWFLFVLFFLIQILMNMDHGTMPAATEDIRKDLSIDDDILGIFGSLVFLGNLIGSILSFSMINSFSRKFMFIFSLILNSICLYTFTITDIIWVLFANRIIVGIFQAYVSIYLPVWCDQFGIRNKKTMMISLIQVGSPLGVVSGYILTSLLKRNLKWSFSFVFQSIMIATTVMFLIFVPGIYFSSTLAVKEINKTNEAVGNKSNPKQDEMSVFRENNRKVSGLNPPSLPSKISLFKSLCIIFKERVFMTCALGLSSLFFVITAVQYWGTDYMEQSLKVVDKDSVLMSFSIVCITSPTFGVLMGGWLSSKIGGYESKHSILLCLVFAILAALCSIPVTLVNDVTQFTIFLWLVLFFGGALLPPITGILISSLPNPLRGMANSITSFFSNLFGYLPAPFVYGMINNYSKESNDRLAFFVIMMYSFVGVFFLSLACYFRYITIDKIQKDGNSQSLISEKEINRISGNKNSGMISDSLAKVFGSNVNYDDAMLSEEEQFEEEKNEKNLDQKSSYVNSNKENDNRNINSSQTPQLHLISNTNFFSDYSDEDSIGKERNMVITSDKNSAEHDPDSLKIEVSSGNENIFK